jgi:Flp pilus assembly CpaE family ATPase
LQLGIEEGRIELVLNRAQTEHERIRPDEVEKLFGRPVFASIPNDYKHITASRDLGHPILATAPQSPARHAIEGLARTLAQSGNPAQAPPAKRRGFLGIFARKTPAGKAART